MSPLSAASAEALARLRLYRPPSTLYHTLPLTRRAAVLILLFADRRGDLRVVLTRRSSSLRTFAGQVALPGGRADFLSETPEQTARREAWEEIGLPLDDGPQKLPKPFSVEYITELPCALARTHVAVRPVVAYLKDSSGRAEVEEMLAPRLQKSEVESVFTVPVERFLGKEWCGERWYSGNWVDWNGKRFRMHEFRAPVWDGTVKHTYNVWGMTARIMVDLARVAYGRDPEFEYEAKMGDEEMIQDLVVKGEMEEKPRKEKKETSPDLAADTEHEKHAEHMKQERASGGSNL